MNFDGSSDSKPERATRPRGHSLQSPLKAQFPQRDIQTEANSSNPSEPSPSPDHLLTISRSEAISFSSSSTDRGEPRFSYDFDHEYKQDFLHEATGRPPKVSYLTGRFPRRSTLADKVELDAIVRGTVVVVNDELYLPLSAATFRHLQPYVNGAKPVAEKVSLFSHIIFNKELNDTPAHLVVAALREIGHYVTHVLVVAPINTSELGDVFSRNVEDMGPGNDWKQILNCFPNLKRLALLRSSDVGETRLWHNTYNRLCKAIEARQSEVEVSAEVRGSRKLLRG